MGSEIHLYEIVVSVESIYPYTLIVTLGQCDIGPGYIMSVSKSDRPQDALTVKELSIIIGEKMFSSERNVFDILMRLITHRHLLLKHTGGYCSTNPDFESPTGYRIAGDWLL